MTWGVTRSTQDRTATDLQELGAQWVRVNVSWSDWVEPSKGSYSNSALSRFDHAIDLARGAGYRVIVMVEESPSWAHDGTNKNSPPRDNADLATFMAFLANRYEGRVQAYQVWNEPNLPWAWPSGPNPGQYAQMLRDVAPSIRAADPTAKVLFAGLSRNDYSYLEGAYSAMPDLGRYFDVMATHPYTYNGHGPESVWYDPNGRVNKGAFSAYREVRKTMEAHGDFKPIWFTEFGWSTTTSREGMHAGVSPETQAAYLTRAYQCLEQDPYVQVATWYSLRNEYWEDDADTWVTQLGLMTTDFVRKPAFHALQNYTPGAGGCRYNTPPLPTDVPSVSDLVPTAPVESPTAVSADPDQLTGVWTGPNSSPRLAVQRALIREGRLVIDGRVARGATGIVRGVAAYGALTYPFTARIASDGKIRVRKQLPGGTDTSFGWIGLVYKRTARFHGQWVILQAAARSARLKVKPDVSASSVAQSHVVRGSVAPEARGSVLLALAYRTADGIARLSTARSRIHSGEFERSLKVPSGARDPIVYAIFPGDPERGIGGSSRTLALPSR